jgi:hypothetical protein
MGEILDARRAEAAAALRGPRVSALHGERTGPVSKLPDRLMPKAADILSRLLELDQDEQIGVLAAVAAAFCYSRDRGAPGRGVPRGRQ